METKDRIVGIDDASKITGFSKSTLYKLTSEAKIDHYKPNGKKIFFRVSDIEKFLLSNPVKCINSIRKKALSRVVLVKGK